MNLYQVPQRMKAAEARRKSLINIDMRGGAPTAYGRSALILHAIYPQLPLRHVACTDGTTRPMVAGIPQRIVREVCRKYRLVEATARLVAKH